MSPDFLGFRVEGFGVEGLGFRGLGFRGLYISGIELQESTDKLYTSVCPCGLCRHVHYGRAS